MYTIIKNGLIVHCNTEIELGRAVKVLTDQNVPVPSMFGNPLPPIGVGQLGDEK